MPGIGNLSLERGRRRVDSTGMTIPEWMKKSNTQPSPPPVPLAKPSPPEPPEEPDPLPEEQALAEPEPDLEPAKAGPEPYGLATPDEHADDLAGAAGETETPATDSALPWWKTDAVETPAAGASLAADDHANDADDAIPVDVGDDGDNDNDDAQETGTGDLRTPAAGRGTPATVYQVLLVAPSDVAYERSVTEKAIGRWNSEHTEELGVVLVARRWRTGEDSRLWEQADLLVGVFGGMSGMRKSDASSSSSTPAAVEEYLKSQRGALVYFSACAAKATDESEGRRLRELRLACERRQLATEFSSPVHLKELLADDLTKQVQRLRGAARAA